MIRATHKPMPVHQSPAGNLRPASKLAGWEGEPTRTHAVIIAASGEAVVKQLKERLNGAYTTHEVSEWEALDRTISTLAPAVVLLDLALLRSSGIEDLSIIRRISRKSRIIVLSPSPKNDEAIAGLRAGARGYCDRNLEASLLRRAVDCVRDGEIWAGRRLIPILVEQFARDFDERPEPRARSDRRLALLTPREQEIASMIGAGASNRDIAARLKVGEGTVKAHLTSIFRKLGFADRLQLGLFLAGPVGRRRH
jgi:two-component system nitrate/nitrite response regulator NarL